MSANNVANIGQINMENCLQKISNILNKYDKICVIDVGFHRGHFIESLLSWSKIDRERFKIIAIDPFNYQVKHLYDRFFGYAVSDVEEITTFNTYDEPGCNSLLRLKTENQVSNLSDNGWFCTYPITKTGEIEVEVKTLNNIISQYIDDPIIHFLKIDAQGNDIKVVKGAEQYLDRIMFIQLESSIAKKDSQIMYENQTTIAYDVDYMQKKGFEVLNIENFSSDSPPEANVIFYNKKMIGLLNTIKLIILDVDGVLTDGRKYYDRDGVVCYKVFCDKDWTAIKRFKALGIPVLFLTGDSYNVSIAKKRNIDVYVNRNDKEHKDKSEYLNEICSKYSVTPDEIVYVGDDIFDLRIMESVGYAFCPSDSPVVIRENSFTLNSRGGDNLIVELFEYLERFNLLPKYDINEHLKKIYEIDIKEKF